MFEFEVLSTKRSTVAESLAKFGALEPHGRGADKKCAFPAGRFAVDILPYTSSAPRAHQLY